ncbi:MAG: TIGR00341 family protein [bacterium]|nr:TIGR00341 family protein [bacterium]
MSELLKKIPILQSVKQPNIEHRERIQERIQEEARPDADYFILLTLSAVIVALGLIINSEATIIGGMLIAPLFWPITALALAMMRGKKVLLTTSIITLIKSFIVIFIIGVIFGLISPFKELGEEVLVHTEPTIFELMIAIAAGLGGAFTVVYSNKAAAALFGVAIAVALVPPISVAGILVGNFDFENATGALLLFTTNFLAILLTSSLIYLYGHFSKINSKIGEERRKRALVWALGSFFVILIPILILSWNVISDTIRQNEASDLFHQQFPEKDITQFSVSKGKYAYTVSGTLYVKDSLPREDLQTFTNRLSNIYDKPVNLDLQIIPYKERNIYSE